MKPFTNMSAGEKIQGGVMAFIFYPGCLDLRNSNIGSKVDVTTY